MSTTDRIGWGCRLEYFEIESSTGKLRVKKTLDFEDLRDDKRITFDLQVSCWIYCLLV